METEFDVIVVGAGTAGCLLANRLSRQDQRRVLLVEAGPRPRNLWVDMPAGVSRLIFPGKLNWGFSTEPEPELHGRRIYAPRGRGLGGSSLINGMGFYRGQPQDYDEWAARGLEGWSWDDVLPLYRRFETREGAGSERRGRTGELHITDSRRLHPSSLDFIEAAKAAGIAYNADFNDVSCDGVGPIQFNIHRGVRHSSSRAFLDPIRGRRPNLEILTDAQVLRVVVENGRARGIELRRPDGTRQRIGCRGEVVLCAGAFGSPHLLLHSGIGPASDLQAKGIAVSHDLPGVGRNLHDHLYIHHTYACSPGSSMNPEFRGLPALLHGARYLLTRGGPLTNGASQACAFVRSRPELDRPDLQISFRPVSWTFAPDGTLEIGRAPEITVSVCHLRPASRGHVTLASDDPLAAPLIHANYLTAASDRETAVLAVRKVRDIFTRQPLAGRILQELAPGSAAQDDDEILDYVRRTAQSMHHWAGSCAMGPATDPGAVVDAQLRVRGVAGLRVADASVMPSIVSANTNAASFMIAEKTATFFT